MNIRKEKAAIPVGNQLATPAATFTASSVSPATLARTPIVDTIASFAVKPEIEAATGCHSPNPSGAKIGAITPPIARVMESNITETYDLDDDTYAEEEGKVYDVADDSEWKAVGEKIRINIR